MEVEVRFRGNSSGQGKDYWMHRVCITGCEKIMDLKQRINEEMPGAIVPGLSFGVSTIVLIRDGFVLPNTATLDECGVTENSVIHMVSTISAAGRKRIQRMRDWGGDESVWIVKPLLFRMLHTAKVGDGSTPEEHREFSRLIDDVPDPLHRLGLMSFRQVFGTRYGLKLMKEAGGNVELMAVLGSNHLCREDAMAFFPAIQQLVNDPTTSPLFPELMRRAAETGHMSEDLAMTLWESSNRDLLDRVLADVPSRLAAEDEWDKVASALAGTDEPGLRVRAAMEDPRVLMELFSILQLSPALVGMCGRVLRGEAPRTILFSHDRFLAWHFAAGHVERQ
jgi:hypothetical protein